MSGQWAVWEVGARQNMLTPMPAISGPTHGHHIVVIMLVAVNLLSCCDHIARGPIVVMLLRSRHQHVTTITLPSYGNMAVRPPPLHHPTEAAEDIGIMMAPIWT